MNNRPTTNPFDSPFIRKVIKMLNDPQTFDVIKRAEEEQANIGKRMIDLMRRGDPNGDELKGLTIIYEAYNIILTEWLGTAKHIAQQSQIRQNRIDKGE